MADENDTKSDEPLDDRYAEKHVDETPADRSAHDDSTTDAGPESDDNHAGETKSDDKKSGVTGAASKVVHGVADTGKAAVGKAQEAAKNALPDAVPDVADKLVDAAAGFVTSTIDRDTKVVDKALSFTRGASRPVRIALVIAAIAIITALIARRR